MQSVKTKFFQYGAKEIEYLSKSDPILGKKIQEIGHVYREVIPDIFAALIHAIIGQLISAKAAKTIWQRMQNTLGEISPSNLVSFPVEDIQQCGITFKKAMSIQDLSGQMMDLKIDFENFQNFTDQQVIEYLTKIPGIGVWTAEMILLNSMERPNILSWKDIAIKRGLSKLYNVEQKEITRPFFDECLSLYTPYSSVASIYLWEISFHEDE